MEYHQQLVRGSLLNLLGFIPKLTFPLILFTIAWLFGTNTMGLYFQTVFFVEILNYLIYSGYCDATSIFASRHADQQDQEHQDSLYRIFANAFTIPTLLGLGVGILCFLFIEPLILQFLPDKPELADALKILIWIIPLLSLSSMCVAATRALMIMKYEVAIHSTLYPILLLSLILAAWFLDLGLLGLMWARVLTQGIVLVCSIWAFSRHFNLSRTVKKILHFQLDWEMVRFVIPQNLNMALNRYITRIDVLMLSGFGFSNHFIAFYSTAVLITSNIREIKQVFASILGPIIVRQHTAKSPEDMSRDLSKVLRWITTIAVPVILAVIILRNDILLLFDNGFSGDTLFMVILLLAPLCDCSTGMAGNCVAWTGHSVWNLFNSVLVSVINTFLNLMLIPLFGLTGAAIATVCAIAIVSTAQLFEIYFLEKVKVSLAAVYKPWAGLFLCLMPFAMLGDPAQSETLWFRVLLTLQLTLLFYGSMLILQHPEILSFSCKIKEKIQIRKKAR